MKNSRVVYVLIGPRGAGKSQYAKKLAAEQPELQVVSRDEILVRLFGSEHCDRYSGGHHLALEEMNLKLRQILSATGAVSVVLDTWTGDSAERKYLIRELRDLGATRIVALYFVTPLDHVVEWFWKKPGIAKISEYHSRQGQGLVFHLEDTPRRDYKLFHKLASEIESDGFNKVIRIDPTQQTLAL